MTRRESWQAEAERGLGALRCLGPGDVARGAWQASLGGGECRGLLDRSQGAAERLSLTRPPAFGEVFSLLPSSSGINPGLGRHEMVPVHTSLMSSVLVTVACPQGSVLAGRTPVLGASFCLLLGEWL